MPFETKKLCSGAWSGVSASTILGTVPLGKRWIITAFRVQGRLGVSGQPKTVEIKAGDLVLSRFVINSVAGADFPYTTGNNGNQTTTDLLQNETRQYHAYGVGGDVTQNAHNSLVIEANENVEVVMSGVGTVSLNGSYNVSGIEVTL